MSIESYFTVTFTPYTVAPSTVYPYDLEETAGTSFLGSLDLIESYGTLGKKQFDTGQETSNQAYLICCASPSSVTVKDRIKCTGHSFIVRSVDPILLRQDHHTEIMVEEVI